MVDAPVSQLDVGIYTMVLTLVRQMNYVVYEPRLSCGEIRKGRDEDLLYLGARRGSRG